MECSLKLWLLGRSTANTSSKQNTILSCYWNALLPLLRSSEPAKTTRGTAKRAQNEDLRSADEAHRQEAHEEVRAAPGVALCPDSAIILAQEQGYRLPRPPAFQG
eukprot:scaffold995_cov244-Pinguiococcus_pyrenoidosus.AAC.15